MQCDQLSPQGCFNTLPAFMEYLLLNFKAEYIPCSKLLIVEYFVTAKIKQLIELGMRNQWDFRNAHILKAHIIPVRVQSHITSNFTIKYESMTLYDRPCENPVSILITKLYRHCHLCSLRKLFCKSTFIKSSRTCKLAGKAQKEEVLEAENHQQRQ